MKKRLGDNGAAVIFWVLGALILIMLALILVPKYMENQENVRIEQDNAHEQTAWDSAFMEFSAYGAFRAVYDYKNKVFVVGVDAKKVEPYGQSRDNIGKVIYVQSDGDGNIYTSWGKPMELPELVE